MPEVEVQYKVQQDYNMTSQEKIDQFKEWEKQFRTVRIQRFFVDLANRALAGVIGGMLAGLLLYYMIWSNK